METFFRKFIDFIVSPCAGYSNHTTIRDNVLTATPSEFLQLTGIVRCITCNLKIGI